MLRWIVNTVIRGIKKGIPSLKRGIFEGTRQTSNVHHCIESFTTAQQPFNGVNLFRKFFFSHWLQMTSRNAHLRCHPVLRTASQRNSTTLFLTFVGFAYIGNNDNLGCENFTKSDQNLHSWLQDALKKTTEKIPEKSGTDQEGKKLIDYEICERLGNSSSNSAVYAAKTISNGNESAIKMLFNYNASSQSHSLKKAFSKEITVLSGVSNERIQETSSGYIALPEHHNIMNVLCHFADNIPELPDASVSYPAALPSRLHENGYGRNRTMFLVMPRFAGTLSNYTHQSNISTKTSLALFTQMLEGLVHLNKNNVAHRDLKNDNLLVSESTKGFPHLVITDFGCCLAEKHVGLVMPYETDETSKGGNGLFMAPEVACVKPGQGRVIDYSKADEWAAGVLAYEMFGQQNPFEQHCLKKETYKISDLPELQNAPKAIQKLVKQLLQRHPNDRPAVSLAATLSQLVLWAPWLFEVHKSKYDLTESIKRWLSSKTLHLAVKMSQYTAKDAITVDQRVLYTFLSRTTAEEILDAIEWLNTLKE